MQQLKQKQQNLEVMSQRTVLGRFMMLATKKIEFQYQCQAQ